MLMCTLKHRRSSTIFNTSTDKLITLLGVIVNQGSISQLLS